MYGFIRLLLAAAMASSLFACEGTALLSGNPDDGALPQTNPTSPLSDQQPTLAEADDEPEASPAAPSAPRRTLSAADITDLILVSGQSNALGAQTDYDASLDTPNDRAFAFTENGWRVADLHQVWDRAWFPRMHPDEDPSNNFAFHMARNAALQNPEIVVGFILVTDPGKRIENWDIDGEFWQSIDTRVIDAINQLPHKSQLDGILWHQGESNAGEPDYHGKLDSLIDNFRTQSWFAADKPFICGETAAYELVNRQLMELNSDGDRWTGCQPLLAPF